MELKHEPTKELNIAIGKSRHSAKWRNTTITWGELVEKLKNTTRTKETYEEYLRLNRKKEKQDEIKDVGGFVGGHLREGRRRIGYVENRSIISLDADFAPPALWSEIKMLAEFAMLVYSTHKHSPEKPRLRILIPLARNVNADEYQAIARKIAEDMGIEYFDDTTYEPNRLMYWPSTAKDAEYLFDVVDLPMLDPDKILAKYTNWKDISYWPESTRSAGLRKRKAAKQGDPLTKLGLIGAFCRTYNIHEAIETFLPEVYEASRTEDRYTYANGSTASGLVVYDDKFAYSNHGTDPISGQLCNAFDLVRIHKFGELDKDSKEDTAINKMPSWVKMMELIQNDKKSKITIGKETLDKAKNEFSETLEDDNDDNDDNDDIDDNEDGELDWLALLTTNKNGTYESTIDNIYLILLNDPNIKGMARRNIFADRKEITRKMSWIQNSGYWTDIDDAGLRHYLQKVYKLKGKSDIDDAFTLVLEKHSYHPVKNYLEKLEWDGKPRMETILCDYLGADDTEYTRTVTRKFLTAAIARIYEPGCKFDYMLTLTGVTGIGKSLLAKRLGMEWMSDTLTDIRGKEAYEALDGVWIMEMSELVALKKSDRETIKNYISKQEDTYRKAYNKNVTINKRQCVFIGTTNDNEFLDDPKSTRRFWVVQTHAHKRTGTVWDDFTQKVVDQVWAETIVNYKKGENIMDLPKHIAEQALVIQSEHSQESIYLSAVKDYMERQIPANWYKLTLPQQRAWYNSQEDIAETTEEVSMFLEDRDRVCAQEIWYVALNEDKLPIPKAYITKEIKDCIEVIGGWEREKKSYRYGDYGVQRGMIKIK